MAKKPKKVYNAALGRMVSLDYGTGGASQSAGQKVYSDGVDIDRLSITQQVFERSDEHMSRLEREGSAKYEELLHSIYDAVLITDNDGNIYEANVRAETMFRWQSEDIVTMNIIDLISGADSELMKIIRNNIGKKKFTVLEAVCTRSDDSRFNADIVVNRFKSHERNAVCFFIRDVTVRKQAEDELKRANEMMIDAEKVQARIDTISTLLHGLNNPLQILISMAEIDENQEYRKQLNRIMVLLDQLRREQTLEEVIDDDGQSRYELDEEPRDMVASDMNRILVVDDEETLRSIFVDALTSSLPGKTIDPVGDGRQAVEIFQMRHHGIIIMDVSMPNLNGEEAFAAIEQFCERNAWVMPCVIFCTGFVISDNIREIIGDGDIHMCLQKPLALSSLISAVKGRMPA